MIIALEHFLIFCILSLLVALVYSGLRQDDLKVIIRLGLKRFIFFMGASSVLGAIVFYIAFAL